MTDFSRIGTSCGENQYGYRVTPYDGKEAKIIGNHPHAGVVAVCVGCDRTLAGWGVVFKRIDTGETFFVFRPSEVKWL